MGGRPLYISVRSLADYVVVPGFVRTIKCHMQQGLPILIERDSDDPFDEVSNQQNWRKLTGPVSSKL
jgi:hypothetical protein